jgi:exodeoxyribonuclease VII large subunit
MLVDFDPADGQLVELRGRLAVYEPRGELQFVVESMQRAGAGALFEQFLRLKSKLEAEGLFDAERKRPLPEHPRRLGVVTSLAAAALRDVASVLARRACHVGVVVYPSLVQGVEAPAALVQAIELAGRRAEVDVLIVCRGGGSIEDLWAFNDERVVRALAASPIPTLSGIGHETDMTLSDFAADVRAPTPTAAAELAASPTQDCALMLAALAQRLQRRAHHLLGVPAQRLDTQAARLARPTAALQRQVHALAMLAQRLRAAARQGVPLRAARLEKDDARLRRAAAVLLAQQRRRADVLAASLSTLDPRRVLQRGYAWLMDNEARPVSSVERIQLGQRLEAQLADGTLTVEVSEIVSGSSH